MKRCLLLFLFFLHWHSPPVYATHKTLPPSNTLSRNYEVPFTRIQRIYQFDSKIRSLIFQAIEQVELYMRSTLSYYLSHK